MSDQRKPRQVVLDRIDKLRAMKPEDDWVTRDVLAIELAAAERRITRLEANVADHEQAIGRLAAPSPEPLPLDVERLRERIGAVVDRWHHLGLIRFNSRDDGGDDLILRDELVAAALREDRPT